MKKVNTDVDKIEHEGKRDCTGRDHGNRDDRVARVATPRGDVDRDDRAFDRWPQSRRPSVAGAENGRFADDAVGRRFPRRAGCEQMFAIPL